MDSQEKDEIKKSLASEIATELQAIKGEILSEVSPKKKWYSKYSIGKKLITIITSIALSGWGGYEGISALGQRFFHKEIEQWNTVVQTSEDLQSLKDTIEARTIEFRSSVEHVHEEMDRAHSEGSLYHAVGLRADSTCQMWYRDKCGDVYKAYPDLDYSTDLVTYWYYIDKSHEKRYIFNERYD